jgi:hypothetical protein
MVKSIALAILVVLFLFSFPAWPYARRWGYAPTGILGVLVLVVLLLMLL